MNPNDYQVLSQKLAMCIFNFLLWLLVGTIVLINGVSPISYACVWGCLLFEQFCGIIVILSQMNGKKR